MKFSLGIFSIFCVISSSIFAMDIVHTIANQEDENDIVTLINNISVLDTNDAKKVVIVPQKFRPTIVRSTLEKNRYFITRSQGNLVSLKKLFPITDHDELKEILASEIRCTADHTELTDAGFFDQAGKYSNTDQIPSFDDNDTYVYSGGAYTHPEYRKQEINKKLTDFALLTLQKKLIERIKQKHSKKLIFVYGLVQANAGENGPGTRNDRTPTLVRSFLPFAQEIAKEVNNTTSNNLGIEHYRYKAFKPTFDPNDEELKPLSDEHSIPGFGCVLSYNLINEEKIQ